MDGNEPTDAERDRQAGVRRPTTVPGRWARTLRHDIEMVCEIWDRLPEGAQHRLVDEGYVEDPGGDPDPLDAVEVVDPERLAAHAAEASAAEGRRYDSALVPPSDPVVVYETDAATVAVGAAVDEAFERNDLDEYVLTKPVGDWKTITDTRRALADVFADVNRVTLALDPDDVATRHLAALDDLDGVDAATAVDPAEYPDVGRADYGGPDGPTALADRARLLGKRVRDLLLYPGRSVEVDDVDHRTEGPGWALDTDHGREPPDDLQVGIDDWRVVHLETVTSASVVDRLVEDRDPDLVRGPAATAFVDEVREHRNERDATEDGNEERDRRGDANEAE